MAQPDISPLRVAALGLDAGAVGVIAAAIVGWLPPVAAVLAIVWYCIQIIESRTVQKKLRQWRLRRLVKLRAEAVALELAIRHNNFDLRGLDEANQVHQAASAKATELTHEALMEENEAIEAQRLEDALGPLPPTSSAVPKKDPRD